MLYSVFAEDIFLNFYKLVSLGQVSVQHQDFGPIVSFYERISENLHLTKNQANYIQKILEKYKNISANAGYDYKNELSNLQWKLPFRSLDLSKKIYVEQNASGKVEICLKFPYQLKKEFDDEICSTQTLHKSSYWDPNEKIRRLNFYDFNLISLYDFALKHNFEIDESFMSVLADVEEIWQNSESVIPYSEITPSGLQLKNASAETIEWWEKHFTHSFVDDLLLAKSMGYPLNNSPKNLSEKIANSSGNTFWIKDHDSFFSLIKFIKGRVCVILDRTSNSLSWLKEFVSSADKNQIAREEIKVCFRDSKENNTGLNEWIKLAGVGGKVETGRILIFESKPAKWLFKEIDDVKILVTNNIYPPTNTIARDWFGSHPCVIYLGDIKPSEQRGQKIVEL